MANPWERRDDETGLAWLAFCCYRDLGLGRSLSAAVGAYYEARDKPRTSQAIPGHFKNWSADKAWVERCKAWDRHRDDILQEEFEEESRRRGREMARDAMDVQRICLDALEEAGEGKEPISPMVAVIGWDKAVKNERTARGLSGEVRELRHAGPGGEPLPVSGVVDPTLLTLDVLKALKKARQGEDEGAPSSDISSTDEG